MTPTPQDQDAYQRIQFIFNPSGEPFADTTTDTHTS